MRTHSCGALRTTDIGAEVSLCGWVDRRREHGEHLAFVDLRDHTGIVQCVVDGAHDLRSEYVLRVTGQVRARPEGTVNQALDTGEIEVGDCRVEVLAAAEPPPFSLSGHRSGSDLGVDEGVRLRYRYLDLRRPEMQAHLRLRAAVNQAMRNQAAALGFVEVETPLLVASTPEGARDFVVPSRLAPGNFYALPQSPQLFKQVLMAAGTDRYFQIARCLRDEDLRADRQFEFSQLDLEASFVDGAEIMSVVDEIVAAAVTASGCELSLPVARMSWQQAQDRYGTDKPDLRFGMELVDLGATFAQTGFRAFAGAEAIRGIRVAGGAGTGRAQLDRLTQRAQAAGAGGLVWMRVGDGLELDSPVSKFLSDQERSGLVEALEAGPGDLLLMVAGERAVANRSLGALRLELGRPPATRGELSFVWVDDFPLFEGIGADGRPVPAHHPFTMPHPDDLDRLEDDPLSVRSQSYDLVLNGWELGSGSVRIHRPDVQERIFAALGLAPGVVAERFGFLLDAFRYGAPPHAGFAVGIDRLVAILAGQDNIREVIAFPKTQSGSDPLTGAPSPISAAQLTELGLTVATPGDPRRSGPGQDQA